MKLLTLKDARKQRGWTQEQLEDAAGVEQAVISRLERGESQNPTFETVRKLEDALRIRRGSLTFGPQTPEAQAS